MGTYSPINAKTRLRRSRVTRNDRHQRASASDYERQFQLRYSFCNASDSQGNNSIYLRKLQSYTPISSRSVSSHGQITSTNPRPSAVDMAPQVKLPGFLFEGRRLTTERATFVLGVTRLQPETPGCPWRNHALQSSGPQITLPFISRSTACCNPRPRPHSDAAP